MDVRLVQLMDKVIVWAALLDIYLVLQQRVALLIAHQDSTKMVLIV